MKINVYINVDTFISSGSITNISNIYKQGFFLNRKPITNILEAFKKMGRSDEMQIYVISYYPESVYAKNERNQWIDRFLPEIEENQRIFLPYGKKNLNVYKSKDVLIDSNYENLSEWQGIGIAIGNDSEQWNGPYIDSSLNSSVLFYTIKRMIAEQYSKKYIQETNELKSRGQV